MTPPNYSRSLVCVECGAPFEGHFNRHHCDNCRPMAMRAVKDRYVAKHPDGDRAAKAKYRAKPTTQARLRQHHSDRHFGGLRDAVLERDNYRCTACGKPWEENSKAICIHHRDENRSHNTMENLITLCRACHLKMHPHPHTPERREQQREFKRQWWANLTPGRRAEIVQKFRDAKRV